MQHLVVQAPDIPTPVLKTLAKLVEAERIERIDARAFRIRNAKPHADVAALCAGSRIDHAFVPQGRRLADFMLAVMDMDSTLITIECIDELAAIQGVGDQVAAITAAAMRGEIDYAESLRSRVRLLAGMPQAALEQVYSSRLQLDPGAEALLQAFRGHGISTLLVSGGFTFFTDRLKARLGFDHACANEPEIVGGRLTGRVIGTILDAEGKARALGAVRDRLGVDRSRIIGIGDGANDLAFLAEAGVSIAYHAKPAVRARATHCIDYCALDAVVHLFE
jgi:phosphoserine phosphatase